VINEMANPPMTASEPVPGPGQAARKAGDPVLAVEDVRVSYRGGAIEALNGVSLAVHPAEIVVLLGPNGAGKTTMLRTITGLLPFNGGKLTAGSVTFEGKRIDGRPDWSIVRGGIALVMEGRRIFAGLSVEDNLKAGAISQQKSRYKENHDKVMALFPRLAERRSVAGGMLSGGEQQMLAMGRALMQSPRLLLLDEPSLGLAPLVVEQVKQIIVDINKAGTSVVLIEQNAAMALSIADYGYILDRRQIGNQGTGASLLGDESIRDLYLGMSSTGQRHYRRAARGTGDRTTGDRTTGVKEAGA
jgi:ABC-type branched-subunit amino acid transport system ATPase component